MQDFREIGPRLSNWGRWGDDDERGTVNLITPERVVAASQLVKRGAIFDLGIPFDAQRPAAGRRPHQPGAADVGDRRRTRSSRARSTTPTTTCSCRCSRRRSGTAWPTCSTTTSCTTGSRPATSARTARMHCSIDKMAKGIVGRGVLLDIARLKGVDWLQAGRRDHARRPRRGGASARASRCAAGDIVLFRTGWRTKFVAEKDAGRVHGRRAGPRPRLLRSGCTTTRSPSSRPTTGRSRCCRARSTPSCCRCTWCSSATWA